MIETQTIRPLRVMHQQGVTNIQLRPVLDGINEVLGLAMVKDRIQIYQLENWRAPNYKKGSTLVPQKSLEWYLQESKASNSKSGQINARNLLGELMLANHELPQLTYTLVVLLSDLVAPKVGFVAGGGMRGVGVVISLHRFLPLVTPLDAECIKTLTMHEVGHMFGLIPDDRTIDVEMSLGKHCTKICTMRQGLSVPRDWRKMTQDRLRHGPYCQICQNDLIKYFRVQ